MKKHSVVMLLSTSILAASAFAGTMGPIIQTPPAWTWVGTLSAGPVWESGGKTQTFNLAPAIEKTYITHQGLHALFDGEIFGGAQKTLSPVVSGQLGLAIAATSNAKLTGSIWDDADPQFNNYVYRYHIQHTHIAVKGKLLAERGYWLTPWVSGSLGVGFNRAHEFKNTPTIFEALPNPAFASHTTSDFTYTLGAGVQKALNAHWQAGVGYELADWGKSSLGRAAGQTLNSGLALSHFYTNGVLFNLTYLA
jgi:opacity protein-like surface antigen